jgi:putative heme-binding domain-containing protein
VVAALTRQVLERKGDPLEGEKVYMASCSVCHRSHAQGYVVGPNLESVAGRDPESLLTDILDPNRALAPQYQVYVVKTATQELSGVIALETGASLTLRGPMAVDTVVARDEVKELRPWPASLMPEGLEASLTPQNLADLLAYLGAAPKGATSHAGLSTRP